MDVYKIAVRIALTNDMSPVLAIISRDLLGVNAKVRDIEKGFGRWAQVAGGAAAVLGGVAIISGMAKLAERGSEVNHQLELMKLQGMQVAEIHASAARAMQVSGAVLTSTYSENLRHVRELRYAFGDTPDALKYLEAVTKANAALNAMKGGGTDQVWELVKSLEEKGLTAKPADFMSYIDQMTKAVVASGGKVTPAQFFSAFKFGRTAMLGWDENFITQYLPRLIQSWSGGGGLGSSGQMGPGNALMSAFSTVVGGHMTKAAALLWEKLGLATVEKIAGSSTYLTHVRKDLLSADITNPYKFAQLLAPTIMKATGGDEQKMIALLGKLFQNRTAGSIMTQMILQGAAMLGDKSPFEKDARLQRQAFDQRMSYDELIKNDYDTMMKAFHSQWQSFAEAVSQPLTAPGGPVVAALASITSWLHAAAAVAQAHPEAIEIVAKALAGLATALIVGGIVALGTALLGLVGAGGIIVAIAAGLAALAALNWGSIETAAKAIGNAAKSFDATVQEWLKNHLGSFMPRPHTQSDLDTLLGRKSSYVAPPSSGNVIRLNTALNVDGRKLADAVTYIQVRDGAGAVAGSPYHDSTYSTSPVDLVLA